MVPVAGGWHILNFDEHGKLAFFSDSRLMIGVFDSGVGGLTVLTQIKQRLPTTPLVYVADHAFSPYGDLSQAQVLQRSLWLSAWLIEQGCELIVVACNTATAIAIDELRRQFSVPIVGVEPGIKPAALSSKTQKIAILATENTLASQRYKQLIERFMPNVEVISQGCSGLADAIESAPEKVDVLLKRYALPLVERDVDQIVLGCTHYPLIKSQLKLLLPASISIVDTSDAIALEVVRRLPSSSAPLANIGEVSLNTTGEQSHFHNVLARYELLQWLHGQCITKI